MTAEKIEMIIEAALMVAGQPLTIASLQNLFPENERPATSEVKAILLKIKECHQESGIELQEVASGYRLQAKTELSPWLTKLWEERAPRYSRAFLETLALIAYKQPITRAEIEEIRGVSISSNIMKTLQEREWVRIIGYREMPGKPALYGTTKEFLDYFNLKSLTDLPPLTEFKNIETRDDELQVQLAIEKSNVELDSENIPEEKEAILKNDNVIIFNEKTYSRAQEKNIIPTKIENKNQEESEEN
jgi:segregation and condensation protein B